MNHRLSTTFGRGRVNPEQREQLVRSVFRRVAPRYDLMNDLMSMGIHRWWKRRFAREAGATAGSLFVDLAGGTGDIARRLCREQRQVMIVDPGVEMMQVGRARFGSAIGYIAGAAEQIPLADGSVDTITISFGIRNTTDILQAMKESLRVLKPGGHFYCLEFSTPQRWLRPFYNAWSRLVIPRLGALVAGHPDAYTYLIESIREFPDQEEMARMLRETGFEAVSWDNLSFGIACIHRAVKR